MKIKNKDKITTYSLHVKNTKYLKEPFVKY